MAYSDAVPYAPIRCSSPPDSAESLGIVEQKEIESSELRLHGHNDITRINEQRDPESCEQESRPPTRTGIQYPRCLVDHIVESHPEVINLKIKHTMQKICHAIEIEEIKHKIRTTQLQKTERIFRELEHTRRCRSR